MISVNNGYFHLIKPLMHKLKLTLACLFVYSIALGQQDDFISFGKRDRTLRTYFKGMPIAFIHRNGDFINGTIQKIQRDSIFIKQYDIRMMPTPWGTASKDTISYYDLRFHYKEIAAFPRPPRSFEFVRNGTFFMITGGGYTFLHTFNGLIQKHPLDGATLAISGGVAALGFTMKKLRKYYYPIGKKYTIKYIKMTAPEP